MTPRKDSRCFTDTDIDGLVYDKKTGLQWQAGPIDVTWWYENTGRNKWLKGRPDAPSGWRLPTTLELMSLFELDVPLSQAIGPDHAYWWAKGTDQQHDITPLLKVSVSQFVEHWGYDSQFVKYWVYIKEDILTSFSLCYPTTVRLKFRKAVLTHSRSA